MTSQGSNQPTRTEVRCRPCEVMSLCWKLRKATRQKSDKPEKMIESWWKSGRHCARSRYAAHTHAGSPSPATNCKESANRLAAGSNGGTGRAGNSNNTGSSGSRRIPAIADCF